MGKIVGNFFTYVACLLLMCSVVHAEVTLRVFDMEGEKLEQAGVGQPFMLEVGIMNMGKGLSEPEIQGDQGIAIQRTGLFMSTVNGVSTTKYSYKVRIDTPGTFQLGPAVIMYQGSPVTSNVLHIPVAHQQKSKHDTHHKKAFLELKVDKDQVVVGQKINCSLTFYYTNDAISLNQVGQPELEGFNKKLKQEPSTGTERKDGALYRYVRWDWQLYPKKSGKLIIPAHRADYQIESKRRPRGLGAFGFFFGNRAEHERVYSNAEQIHVDPLPAYNGHVDAIGSFSNMRAYIEPALAKQGEAIVLTLELEGDGDLQAIQPPKLQHMPSALKHYESKHYIVQPKTKYAYPKKYFEYIIQGLKEGDWQIPKQTFTYFDVDTYTYKTLETAPLMIQIIRNDKVQKDQQHADTHQEPEEDTQEKVDERNDMLSINEQGQWRGLHERTPLPIWILLLVMSMPIIYVVCNFMYKSIQQYYKRNSVRFRYQKAFKHALSQLKKARKQQKVAHIYHIITQLFADRMQVSNSVITQSSIEEKLKRTGIAKERMHEWHLFYNEIASHAFGYAKYHENDLFEQAKQWIEYLKEVL